MAEQIIFARAIRTADVDLTVIVSWRAEAYRISEGYTFVERRFHYLEQQRGTSAGILKTKRDIVSAFLYKKRKFYENKLEHDILRYRRTR